MSPRHATLALGFTLAGFVPLGSSSGREFFEERPMRIMQTVQANFPAVLAAEGVSEGEVRAVLNVDADGKLIDFLVTAYTRRELAEELAAVMRHWSYEPARQRGEPVGSRSEIVFGFQAQGMVLSLTPYETALVTANRLIRPALTSVVCRPADLDEPVRAVHVVPPQHPCNRVTLRSDTPTVLIDFYIDADGRTRMPVVLRAAHELYAAAAVDALLQWRFAPPTRDGRPVLVRATQVFSFPDRRRD